MANANNFAELLRSFVRYKVIPNDLRHIFEFVEHIFL